MNNRQVGLGDNEADITLYVGKFPPVQDYQKLEEVRPLLPGELDVWLSQCSNDWRKMLNILAKLAFAFSTTHRSCWQDYRDKELLQAGSQVRLMFSDPELENLNQGWHLIAGKTYAQRLGLELNWIDASFARPFKAGLPGQPKKMLITPYFDYRQLTNARLKTLIDLMSSSIST